ncbi:large ribosomal subunit protein uL23m-like [Tubulanus polymorphus]|uniref:large ribosomal subunit protein uL23m-like n=1 Tax=Tubulanus polymorphus TaxID=672921 RepID=UPI003DA3A283
MSHLKPWIPLWKRLVKPYPLYVKGDPQIRIFFPEFWMKLVKPEKKLPSDYVMFHVHPQMTKNDIKQYLEKIYNVPVLSIRTEFRQGKKKTHPYYGHDIPPEDDEHFAYVQLKDDNFQWPDLFGGKKTPQEKVLDDVKKQRNEANKNYVNSWKVQSIPSWFR